MLIDDQRTVDERPSPSGDNSGLIDLSALTVEASDEPIAPMPKAGLFHLDAPPPPPAAHPTSAPPKKGDQKLIGTLIAAIALLSSVIVFKLVTGPQQLLSLAPSMAPTQPIEVPVPPPPVVEAEPLPNEGQQPDEGPQPDPEEHAVAAPTPTPVANNNIRTVRTAPVRTPPKPPQPASNGNCPCEDHDLMCQMRCATGR